MLPADRAGGAQRARCRSRSRSSGSGSWTSWRPGSAAYNIPAALRLRGALDAAALERALDADRRGGTRRCARTFAEVDGEPVQVIAPLDERLRAAGARPVGACARRARRRSAPAERGGATRRSTWRAGPLFRGAAAAAGARTTTCCCSRCTTSSRDGWSMGVLYARAGRALRRVRAGRARSAAAAAGAVRRLRGVAAALAGRARCWSSRRSTGRRRSPGAPELLELPTDHPRPALQDHRRRAALAVELDEALTARAAGAGPAAHGATLFMTLLAGWAALLRAAVGAGRRGRRHPDRQPRRAARSRG